MFLRFRMDKIRYKIKRLWLVNIFERLIAVKSGLRKFSKFPDSLIGDRVGDVKKTRSPISGNMETLVRTVREKLSIV